MLTVRVVVEFKKKERKKKCCGQVALLQGKEHANHLRACCRKDRDLGRSKVDQKFALVSRDQRLSPSAGVGVRMLTGRGSLSQRFEGVRSQEAKGESTEVADD